jgi:hypothetical protein
MRITKAEVDALYALKLKAESATAAYEEAMKKIRDAGPNVYKGACAALVVEEQTRRTVDNKALIAQFKIPESAVEAHTKVTIYVRAIFKEVA